MANTPNRNYPLPVATNNVIDDLAKIITFMGMADTDVGTLFASMSGKVDTSALAGYIATTQKNVANGVAGLNSNAQFDLAQLPPGIIGGMRFQTTWNAATNVPAIPAASAANKDFYWIVSTSGSTNIGGITDWVAGDWLVSTGTGFGKIDNTDGVQTVAGRQGNVVLTKADVGLANVDNTADSAKAFAATQTTSGTFAVARIPDLDAAKIISGTLADARLPVRLGVTSEATIADWNSATFNGFAIGAPATPNAPDATHGFLGHCVFQAPNYGWQRVTSMALGATPTDTFSYIRFRDNGTWGSWQRVWSTQTELDARYATSERRPHFTMITSGTSFTTNALTTYMKVTVVGGGAGGSAGSTTFTGPSGGGGGCAIRGYAVTGSTAYALAVGAAGSAAGNGGNSTFTDGVTLITGGGGQASGVGGVATNGIINLPGGKGSVAYPSGGTEKQGGVGGASGGGFGAGGPTGQSGTSGSLYGGGGSGGYSNGTSGGGGGSVGAQGVIITEEYYA